MTFLTAALIVLRFVLGETAGSLIVGALAITTLS